MGIWDTVLSQLGGGGQKEEQLPEKLKPNTFYSLEKIAKKKPMKAPPQPQTFSETRKKQGAGFGWGDIGE